jgi:hypothetical protein
MIFVVAKNIIFFYHDISYYYVKVLILIFVNDYVILKAFQVQYKKKNNENTSCNAFYMVFNMQYSIDLIVHIPLVSIIYYKISHVKML